jgi:hypothetical protein
LWKWTNYKQRNKQAINVNTRSKRQKHKVPSVGIEPMNLAGAIGNSEYTAGGNTTATNHTNLPLDNSRAHRVEHVVLFVKWRGWTNEERDGRFEKEGAMKVSGSIVPPVRV